MLIQFHFSYFSSLSDLNCEARYAPINEEIIMKNFKIKKRAKKKTTSHSKDALYDEHGPLPCAEGVISVKLKR